MPTTIVNYFGRQIGSPATARQLAASFSRTTHVGWNRVLILAPPIPNDDVLAPLTDSGVTINFIPRPRRNIDLKTVLAVRAMCRIHHADMFHCFNVHTSPMLGAWLSGVPVRVWSALSMQPAFEEGRSPTWRDRLAVSVRLTCYAATHVAAISNAVRAELEGLGVDARKLRVVPSPLNRIPITLEQRRAARGLLGYDDRDVVICTVGHAVPVKGWDVLLRAFSIVASAASGTRLLLVGSTDAPHEQGWYRHLQTIIAELGLADRIYFTGHLADPYLALGASDIFVLPSRSEGNAFALNEAYGAGLPCVATSVGNAPELIKNGFTGRLVPRESVDELAKAILDLVSDRALRERIAAATLEPVPIPTTDEHFEEVLRLYREGLKAAGIEEFKTSSR